jgi:hypothetical protein
VSISSTSILSTRAQTWEALLAATGAPGIHFEDYPELQGYELPEWSHMTQAEAIRFTRTLYALHQAQILGPKRAPILSRNPGRACSS